MRGAWNGIGRLLYWLCWPGIWLYVRPSHRTRIIVVCDDRILVVKDWLGDGRWALPGGGLHHAELAIDGVRRELYEETGIKLDAEPIIHDSTQTFRSHGLRFSYELFLAQLVDQPPLARQTYEIAEVAWVTTAGLSVANAGPDVLTGLRQLAARG